jgi:hypothetical protein
MGQTIKELRRENKELERALEIERKRRVMVILMMED